MQPRTRTLAAVLVAGASVLFASGLVGACNNGSAPKHTVNAGDAAGATSTTASASGGSGGPSGTADAPPASVVTPPPATTTTARHGAATTTPPSAGDTVSATQADDGKTFTLRRGQHLAVTLDDPAWQWSDPDTDNPSVLRRAAVSANASSTHVTASFDADAAGQAHVSASKDAPCRSAQPPCMVPTYLWHITVNVIA